MDQDRSVARWLIWITAVVLVSCAGDRPAQIESDATQIRRPNILLIVVDDMGFADLGSFGGEIDTPNLDALAEAGVRLTNFHGSSMCSPSRAMLLTGVDPHLAGYGNMLEELAPNQKGQPGYEGHLNDRVVTISSLLKDSGYRTYVTGKWHLGDGPSAPIARGFDRSFVLDSGGGSHFSDMRPAYAPSPEVKAHYLDEGIRIQELPSEFEYSSQFHADRMLSYLKAGEASEQPFFAYLAFTAPHWPLQAPDEAIAKYAGRYDEGYDVISERRLSRMKRLGLVPQTATRSSRSPKEAPWESLTEDQRKIELRAMEVYAAMVDQVDVHTGRVIDYLKRSGQFDNTVIIFLSDNGAEGHDLDETWPAEAFPAIRKTIDESHDFSFESMGRPGSYVLYGANWANSAAPAFRLHKAFPAEGGTRTAAFVHYPPAFPGGRLLHDFVSIKDIAPTLLALTEIEHPGTRYKGRDIYPMTGLSVLHVLRGEGSMPADRVLADELLGKRVVRKGDWRLVHMPAPYGNGDWQLFNVEIDLSQERDLSSEYPETVDELLAHWERYVEENGVIIPDWVSGY